MSRCRPNGMPVVHEPLPKERDAFLAEVFEEWANGDVTRVRMLAAASLYHACGWKQQQIAIALGCDHTHVSRMIANLQTEFRAAYAPPLDSVAAPIAAAAAA